MVLRKQTSDETAFLDEVVPEVETEVERQLDSMFRLDDREAPNFSDADYQLAAYAAALRVLTRYRAIEDVDVAYQLSAVRRAAENDGDPADSLTWLHTELYDGYWPRREALTAVLRYLASIEIGHWRADAAAARIVAGAVENDHV